MLPRLHTLAKSVREQGHACNDDVIIRIIQFLLWATSLIQSWRSMVTEYAHDARRGKGCSWDALALNGLVVSTCVSFLV